MSSCIQFLIHTLVCSYLLLKQFLNGTVCYKVGETRKGATIKGKNMLPMRIEKKLKDIILRNR